MNSEPRQPTATDDFLFDLRGYCILRNAVDAAHVDALNAVLDTFPRAMPQWGWRGNVQRFDYPSEFGMELQNIVEAGEPFERLIDHPAWIASLQHWCGEEDSYVAGVFIDECFANIRAKGGYFPIHSGGQDGVVRNQYRFVNGKFRCGQVNVLLALTDIGAGDGGTMVVPGSHKANFPHPNPDAHQNWDEKGTMDHLEAAVEVQLNKGDALLFVDALMHGASERTNPGERRVAIYRYGPSWGTTRHGYRYSPELLERLTPARRKILQPVPERVPM